MKKLIVLVFLCFGSWTVYGAELPELIENSATSRLDADIEVPEPEQDLPLASNALLENK